MCICVNVYKCWKEVAEGNLSAILAGRNEIKNSKKKCKSASITAAAKN